MYKHHCGHTFISPSPHLSVHSSLPSCFCLSFPTKVLYNLQHNNHCLGADSRLLKQCISTRLNMVEWLNAASISVCYPSNVTILWPVGWRQCVFTEVNLSWWDWMPRHQIQDVLAQMSLGRYGSHIDRGLWVWIQLDRISEFALMGRVPTAIDSARCVARIFGDR